MGLGLFCVTGTVTAYRNGLGAVPSALLGTVTAVGGGVIRDLLAGRTPLILRPEQEIYAIPALFGASITALTEHLGWYNAVWGAIAGAAALSVRLLALRFGWQAPTAKFKELKKPAILEESGSSRTPDP